MNDTGQIIIGTAGHIDHGKTTLIKALTGVDTDRLEEEKRRGISIELGFAKLQLPDGRFAGVIDVPGHEKFIRNMLAGAAGIDLVLLVIAADEGVMPQTREHVAIVELLGIQSGIVVLTKVDLVDKDWLALVEEDIKDFIATTSFKVMPIAKFSAITGEGKTELLQLIADKLYHIHQRSHSGQFRMPVDRSFIIKGFGTVVTGTLWSGQVKVGDEVIILPGDTKARVRKIEVHGESVDNAGAGLRTAISLAGIEKSEVPRGFTLVHPNTLRTSLIMDAKLRLITSSPWQLEQRQRVRLHLGTAEVMARVVLFDKEILEPGEEAWVQLRLEEPLVAVHGDRFVIRSYSPITTIGGGTIIEPQAIKHTAAKPPDLHMLQQKYQGNSEEIIEIMIAETTALELRDLKAKFLYSPPQLNTILQSLVSKKSISIIDDKILVHNKRYSLLKHEILTKLTDYHKVFPFRRGIPKDELLTIGGKIPSAILEYILMQLVNDGKITLETGKVRLKEFSVQLLGADVEKLTKEIILKCDSGDFPEFDELIKSFGDKRNLANEIIIAMMDSGQLFKMSGGFLISQQRLANIINALPKMADSTGVLQVSVVKDKYNLSRKYVIPLLEHLDRIGVTYRDKDERYLNKNYREVKDV